MLTLLPCWSGDVHRAENLLKWIAELGGCANHDLIIIATPTADLKAVKAAATGWKSVKEMVCHDEWKGHPSGANRLFAHAVRYVEHFQLGPFLWLEPDAIPLKPGWLDQIDAEYKTCGKVFMGHHSRKQAEAPHMNGVGVWHRVSELAPISISIPEGEHAAFDVESGPEVIQHLHETKLIQFEYMKEEERLKDTSLLWLRPEAVLWHTDKTHKLIWLLQQRMSGTLPVTPEALCPFVDTCEVKESGGKLTIQDITTRHPLIEYLPLPNVIYGFYGEVPEIERAECMAIAEIWKERWTLAGWIPIILTVEHAEQHPNYDEFLPSMEALPTINPKRYELMCMLRWLAVAQVGGGWMCDFDCMPVNFPPRKVTEKLTCWQPNVPCLVSGPASEYLKAAKAFAYYTPDDRDMANGKPHVSDMLILQRLGIHENRTEVKNVNRDEGWEKAAAIHFSNYGMNGFQPRSKNIMNLLPRKLTRAEVLAKARANIKRKPKKVTA